MRNFKHHLESIDGVDIYPLISLLIFFLFFVALGYYVYKMKKSSIDYIKNLPLTEDSAEGALKNSEK